MLTAFMSFCKTLIAIVMRDSTDPDVKVILDALGVVIKTPTFPAFAIVTSLIVGRIAKDEADPQVKELMKKYPDHAPPVKLASHARIQSHRAPVDKDTNKPAMILNVDVNEPNADDSVDAVGRWYAGDAVTGFRAFSLKKTDGQWQITAVK